MSFLLFRYGAVRAAANLCDMPGSIQKSKALAMSTPCMDGLVDYVRRQVKCPECRAEHRIPYQVYILIILKHITDILIYNIIIIIIEYGIELFIFKIIINEIINFCVCVLLTFVNYTSK